MRCFPLAIIALILSDISYSAVEVAAWSRATPPGATSGVIYGRFENIGNSSVEVISVSIDLADYAMIHESHHYEGMASMKESELVIPALSSVELKPGGKHIMLFGLDGRLVEGCSYSFRLSWSDGSTSSHRFLAGGIDQLVRPETSMIKPCY